MEPVSIKDLYKQEVANDVLRRNLAKATLQAVDKRDYSFREVDIEFLRSEAKKIKDEAVGKLNELLSQFEDVAEKNGCTVFFASDSEKARQYTLEVARSHGVKRIVKSKSMVTEEIDLVPFLERNGIEAVETDLGEYIVQLAGEKPSHITTPAIHMSRGEIAELFHRKIGTTLNSDPAFLTAEARRVLREKFLSAEMGISGANFLVAETGDIVIVENEGNARLSTSAVKVHLVITGIEKIIGKFSDLRIFMRLLARSSTGQKLTSYLSLIRGPRKEFEKDGPDEVHLVLVDNGRSGLLGSEYQDVLDCIRCGACLNVCPVYRNIGGHAYGSVYPGPIGSLVTPLYFGLDKAGDLPFASSLCGNCTEVCPVGIDIHHHLLSLRSEVVSSRNGLAEKQVFRQFRAAMLRPARYKLLGSLVRKLSGTSLLRKIAGRWTKYRALPDIPPKTFREIYKKRDRRDPE